MRTLGQITSAGLEKISVLDLDSKALISDGAPVYIDEDLASQLTFVKEGHFVDTGGNPTLVLKGSVETATGAHPIAMPEKVPTTINDSDILEAFLRQKKVQKPELYIQQICHQSSGNLPVFHFMKIGKLSNNDAISLIESIERKSAAKKTLLTRLKEGKSAQGSLGKSTSTSGKRKQYYHDRVCRKQATVPSDPLELKYFLAAIRGMQPSEILTPKETVFESLYSVLRTYMYKEGYEGISSEFRYACCWVDEVLNR